MTEHDLEDSLGDLGRLHEVSLYVTHTSEITVSRRAASVLYRLVELLERVGTAGHYDTCESEYSDSPCSCPYAAALSVADALDGV